MTEKRAVPGDPNPIVELYRLEIEKRTALNRLRAEGRPVWGDEEVHQLRDDIEDIESQIKKHGSEIQIPLDDEAEELRRRLLEISNGDNKISGQDITNEGIKKEE